MTRTEAFGVGPSGGNVLVPARTLRRSRLKGRCRQSRPLKNPPAASPEVRQKISGCDGHFNESTQIEWGFFERLNGGEKGAAFPLDTG